MKFKRKKADGDNQIDISPLIDMVFILLIFFMVSTTFVKDMQLDLERPGATSSVPSSSKSVRVYIDRAGDVFIDGQAVRVWALQGKLRQMLQVSGEKSVLVVTDKAVAAEKLIEVVDYCRLAGADDIGVATNHET